MVRLFIFNLNFLNKKAMKNILIFLAFYPLIGFSQIPGSITPEKLEKIRKNFNSSDPVIKAATNAATENNLKKLTLNRQNVGKIDHNFKYKVSVKGITDQKNSGRCWMFTSLNVMRPKVIAKIGSDNFEFSTNYLYFWDQFEKANLFLEGIISTANLPVDDRTVVWLMDNALGDGGVWNLFADLVEKYGIIPKSAMQETENSENTDLMQKIIRSKLREDALVLREFIYKKSDKPAIDEKKLQMLGEVYKMLAICLGEPPTKFQWRYNDKDNKLTEYKEYTPKSFYDEYVGVKLSDYVLLMDDPTHDYNKLYEIEYDRNMFEGTNWKFINLPSTIIKEYARKSIMENEALYFSCDVGKQLNSEDGYLSLDNYDVESLFGVKFGMNKKQRIQTRESGSTHGMALVGCDVDANNKITKWQLENSWGTKAGHDGYLTMTDEWFDQYMFRIVVNKKFVDPQTLKILEQIPLKLPPWDPMFEADK
ncbi:MAG: hypothetical protein A2046_14055 [Bacteroidetes bacterium GWA2_30_7]|nr:MAG: hypothetical protein A2046_14055 [Bacteroidetes bacterium GWA2_30_7]